MLKQARIEGKLNDDTVIIEPTSGNTGIGLAMCCAAMGLKIIVVMPENMSEERKKVIKAYGAELVLTPKEFGMQGAVDEASRLNKEIKNSFIPMQFSNESNSLAHVEMTAREIWTQTEGKVDIFVAGIGTGGTITGTARGLKSFNQDILCFGVEPKESPLLTDGVAGSHKIQGIGAGFIPKNCDVSLIDWVFRAEDEKAIEYAKLLAKKEGILSGISGGAAVYAALALAKLPENKDKLIVAIIPDSAEKYLSTSLFE